MLEKNIVARIRGEQSDLLRLSKAGLDSIGMLASPIQSSRFPNACSEYSAARNRCLESYSLGE